MSQIKMISSLKFAPYPYAWVTEKGERHEWYLIAIKYNEVYIRLTTFHNFVGVRKGTKNAMKLDNDQVRRVCNFLTYALFEKHHVYKANSITEIPFKAAEDYLLEYAKTKNRFANYPSLQSVEKERCAICHFMKNIGKKRKDHKEHYYVRQILASEDIGKKSVFRKNRKTAWEYEIEAKYFENKGYTLIRDIPNKAIPIILKHVRMHAPELFFAVCLQLFAGLREGEVVNVRRPDSRYYGGIRIRNEYGRFLSFEIDLTKELQLRSDGKYVGSIKQERTQQVYTPFLEIVQYAYEAHMKLITKDMVEPEGPMFVNSYENSKIKKRMAISKQSYCKRIIGIMRDSVLPELMKSEDIELRTFAKLVNENSWGLHAFRHWFTVQLVLNNEDINGIATWRGDASTESAFEYLSNKGELMKKYKKANENVADKIMTGINKN